jgi:hypothetical protein
MKYYYGSQIKGNKMCEACSTHTIYDIITTYSYENLSGRNNLRDTEVDGRIMLNLNLIK